MRIRKRSRPRPSRRLPLQPRHYHAIELLAGLRDNYGEVADAIGVSRMTLYRYRMRPDFRRELRKATARLMREKEREMKRKYVPNTAEDYEWYFAAAGLV